MKSKFKTAMSVAILCAAINANGQQNSAGIEAFRSGDYQAALAAFEEAERAGSTAESLQYNIAVSLYRLGRYDEARERFEALVGKSQWQVLVRYNLALVAQATANTEAAIEYFRLSAQQQENEKVRTLAQEKLQRLQSQQATRTTNAPSKRFTAVVSLSGGEDSNATSLADELLESRKSAKDSFHEVLLYGQWQASGSQRNGLRFYALGFDRAFNTFDNLDSSVVGFGSVYSKPVGRFQVEGGVRATHTSLAAEDVADQLQVSLGVSRDYAFGLMSLNVSAAQFNAAERFQQIDGDQQAIELKWEKKFAEVTIRSRYRVEQNERQDQQRGGAFASYSPQRQALRMEMRWQASQALSTGIAAEYIDSQYGDKNRLRDVDGSIKEQQRENSQVKLNADISYRLSSHWRLKALYQFTEQRDNFSIYDYNKHRVLGSIEYTW